MQDFLDANRQLWDRWTQLHRDSRFYDLDGFREGRSRLGEVEREALGDVTGRSLLHLQCHFGLDTLLWARAGATVTGVDFSAKAIALARSLSDELEIPARFIQADLYDLPNHLDEQFDVVFSSYGVLCWLPDLARWAEVVAHFLKPGGTFFLVEFHPLLDTFGEDGAPFAYPYFRQEEPLRYEEQGSYAEHGADVRLPSYTWPHSLGETVTALAEVGLRIEALREYPFTVDNGAPFLEEQAPGRHVVAGQPPTLPLMFSVRASKRSAS